MSKYNPKIHNRRSIRLKGYDYSQPGFYFITICVQKRKKLFGKIVEGKMILNDPGQMIEKWYFELENKFPEIQCHAMVVMPDHFHCIIQIVAVGAEDFAVGAEDFAVGAEDFAVGAEDFAVGVEDFAVGADLRVRPLKFDLSELAGSQLWQAVQWFKTMTTNEYIRGVKTMNWQPFDKKLWQRNYYEHIIRNPKSYKNISKYIIDNPQKI